MPERVLITGGSGFIGACLAHDLIALGDDVHLLLRPEHRGWRLTGAAGRYTPHCGDLRDAAAVRRAVDACRPEVIYHLATHGAYPSQRDRAEILATNLQGTINLIEAVKRREFKAFVHVGSSSEYGHKNQPMRECDSLEPRTDYAVGKAAASLFCLAEARRGLPVAVVRVFSAYGPWEEPGRLVPYTMDCCLRGIDPRLTSGAQPRDFIHVADVVDLLKCAANCPAALGKVVHAGTGREHRARDMVETIVALSARLVQVGRGVTPEFGALESRPDEPNRWVASIEQTQAMTGWSPRYDLRRGVEATWDWLRKRIMQPTIYSTRGG